MKKLIFNLILVCSFALVVSSCSHRDDELVAPIAVESIKENNIEAKGFSDCSYPQPNVLLSSPVNSQYFSSGSKYAYKRILSSSQYRNNRFSFKLEEGGPIVVRSVREKTSWFGSTYEVYESCSRISNVSSSRTFSTYGSADFGGWDNIYYEVIVEGNAIVSWNAYNWRF